MRKKKKNVLKLRGSMELLEYKPPHKLFDGVYMQPLRHLCGYMFYHIMIIIKLYNIQAGCTPRNQLGQNGTGMSKVDMMIIVPWHVAEYP